MTDNERRVLEDWRETCGFVGGPFRSTDMVDMLTDLLNADAEPEQITRPYIGEQFWMHSIYEREWSVWTATPGGPATHDADGEPWVRTWSEFDRYVADGTWKWMALEQPDE